MVVEGQIEQALASCKAIYTTNAIESLNATVRRAVRARGHFTSVGAANKLMYLALREASAKWTAPTNGALAILQT